MSLTPQRSSSLEPQKRYKRVLWVGGYTDMDYARNEDHAIDDLERQRLGESVWNSAAVVAGLVPSIVVNNVTWPDGKVWINGRIEPVPGTTLSYSPLGSGSVAYLRWALDQRSKADDAVLVDPNTNDPVQDRLRVLTSLVNTYGDALDEPFAGFVLASDGVTPAYLNSSAAIVPKHPIYGVWSVTSGAPGIVQIGVPRFEFAGQGLKIVHTSGVQAAISLSVNLTPSTPYYVYVSLRTVFGQPDLVAGANGFFVTVSRATPTSPVTSYFGSTGGASLLGDFVRNSFTFNSDGSASPVTITIGVGAGGPTTQVLVDQLLITSEPLVGLDRHYYPLFSGVLMKPVVVPQTAFSAYQVAYVPHSSLYHDISATAQTEDIGDALDELTDLRAKINGDTTKVFNAARAATSTEVPEAAQVQDGSLVFGEDTGTANVYVVALAPVVSSYTEGMKVRFNPIHDCTGASTLDAGGGAKAIKYPDGTAILSGEIKTSQETEVIYFSSGGGFWQLTRPHLFPASRTSLVPYKSITATDVQVGIQQIVDEIGGINDLLASVNLVGNKVSSATPGFNQFRVKADLVVVRNLTLAPIIVAPFGPLTVDITTSGPAAGGRDQSAIFPVYDGSGGGLFHVYAIGGAAVSAALIASLADPSTGPVMPAGYTHYAYLVTLIVNTAGHVYKAALRGNSVTLAGVDSPYRVLATNQSSTAASAISAVQNVPANALSYHMEVALFHANSSGGDLQAQLSLYLDPSDATSSEDGPFDYRILKVPSGEGLHHTKWNVEVPNLALTFYYAWSFPGAALSTYYANFRTLGYRAANGSF